MSEVHSARPPIPGVADPARAAINDIFQKAHSEGRSSLFEHEVYRLLAAAGIAIGAVGLGTKVIDVTESLIAWNAAASTSAGQNAANLGWLFNPTSTDIWDFSSAQGQSAPTLIITYTQSGTTLASLPSVSIASAVCSA